MAFKQDKNLICPILSSHQGHEKQAIMTIFYRSINLEQFQQSVSLSDMIE